MSGRRCPPNTPPAKKKRKNLTLEAQLDIISRYERGEGTTQIGRLHGIPASFVHSVVQSGPKIMEIANAMPGNCSGTVPTLPKIGDAVMQNMERLLIAWIEDQTMKHVPLSFAIIQEKALSLWSTLQGQLDHEGLHNCEEAFTANLGWFTRFKARNNIQYLGCTDEPESVETVAADEFPAKLRKIIEDGGYSPQQVYNIDETGLFWKRLPSNSYVAREERNYAGFKASRDRMTLLIGGNAQGDVKLKPLVVYHSENPMALKGYLKPKLPVIWRSNPKAWVTGSIMQDYVINYFSNFIEKYSRDNNLENKALLLVDNAPNHPQHMKDWCENVKVVFLPPNTSLLLQPVDQGIVAAFKACYLKRVMQHLLKENNADEKPSIKKCWRVYNIKQALEHIKYALGDVDHSVMNGAWLSVWPECVQDTGTWYVGASVCEVIKEVAELSSKAGFVDVDEENVKELLESHSETLSAEDLAEMENQRAMDDTDGQCMEAPPLKQLNLKILGKVVAMFEQATDYLVEQDGNLERSTNVSRAVHEAIRCYKEMYREKEKEANQGTLSKSTIAAIVSLASDMAPSTSGLNNPKIEEVTDVSDEEEEMRQVDVESMLLC